MRVMEGGKMRGKKDGGRGEEKNREGEEWRARERMKEREER